ncbi:MAG: hypothetical protein ACJ74H_06040 [Thermoanaerobaculia bacterium]
MKDRKDVFLRLCELVLSTAAIELLILLVPACISMLTWRDASAPVMEQLVVRPFDLLLIGGLLATLATLWLYLYWVLPYTCETAWDQVVSLGVAVLLFLLNYFVMVPELLPYRYFFVSAVMVPVWYKDSVWRKRFAGTQYEEVVDKWRRNMRFTFAGSMFGAVLFAALLHPALQVSITKALFGQALKGNRAYEIAVAAVFSAVFLATSVRSCMRNFEYFTARGSDDIEFLESLTRIQCSPPAL